MQRALKIIILVLCGVWAAQGVAKAADETAQFDVANQMYEAGKYEEAKAAYNQLAKTGPISANLYYDLGNTEWKMGNGGEATANYVRALELDPSHPQARANLDFVREQLGSIVPTPAWWQNALDMLNANAASVVLSVCGWVALFCIAVMLLRPNRTGPVITLILCLLAGAYAGGCLWEAAIQGTRAIVVEKSVQAREAPTEVAPVADTLPAGSEVLLPEVRGPWTYCTLPDGTRAWVPTEALERVKPA